MKILERLRSWAFTTFEVVLLEWLNSLNVSKEKPRATELPPITGKPTHCSRDRGLGGLYEKSGFLAALRLILLRSVAEVALLAPLAFIA